MLRKVLAVAVFLVVQFSTAASLLDDGLLGLDESTLTSSVPGIYKLKKPTRGPRGLKGIWQTKEMQLASVPLETTFFVRSSRVERIEQQSEDFSSDCNAKDQYFSAINAMENRYGPGLTASETLADKGSYQTIAWTTETVDIQLHAWQSESHCRLLVVFSRHTEKDASEL